MEEKKTPFFIKIKNAVFNFDEYKNFSEEKTSVAIKYFFKLLLMFVLILTIALTCKVVNISNGLILELKNECPEFSFNDYTLQIEGDNKKIVKGDDGGYFGLIIDGEKENLSDIEEASNYQSVIGILNDKIVIKSTDEIESTVTYKQLNEKYDLNNLNRNIVIESLSGNNIIKIYVLLALVFLVYLFITYFMEFMLDILMLSIVGYLFSRLIRMKIKYKILYNMSIY